MNNNPTNTTNKQIRQIENTHGKKGQILLITLLVLTIVITIALSLVSRSTTDTSVSSSMEESARAFNAAEAGIEEAMKSNVSSASPVTISDGVSYTTTVSEIGAGDTNYAFPTTTAKGTGATFFLVSHTDGGMLDENPASENYCSGAAPCTIDICWMDATVKPAAEVIVYYKNIGSNTYDLVRYGFDPDATRTGNKFTRITDTSGCGKANGVNKTSITLPPSPSLPLMLRLRPYYEDTTFLLGSVGGRTFPVQFSEISSEGKTDNGVTRKIVVKKEYSGIPSVFDYILYSTNDIKHELY